MNIGLETLIFLPVGLGLLGFIEPCTIGAHLLLLKSIEGARHRLGALGIFIVTRTLMMGLIGAGFALLGRGMVGAQTGLWLVFGTLYLLIGLGYFIGWQRLFTQRLEFAPRRWRYAKNPAVLGVAFGLNIPACAAPLVFGLFTLSAGSASLGAGFTMMALFGLALSLPLLAINALAGNGFGAALSRRMPGRGTMRVVLGVVFVALGLWSIWFGLYVNPENWSGQ